MRDHGATTECHIRVDLAPDIFPPGLPPSIHTIDFVQSLFRKADSVKTCEGQLVACEGDGIHGKGPAEFAGSICPAIHTTRKTRQGEEDGVLHSPAHARAEPVIKSAGAMTV